MPSSLRLRLARSDADINICAIERQRIQGNRADASKHPNTSLQVITRREVRFKRGR
jgi:hypothetical protein